MTLLFRLQLLFLSIFGDIYIYFIFNCFFYIIHLFDLILIISAINAQNNITRVAGGSDVIEGGAPYQVSVRNIQLQHICGGCILNKDWVLTISRCAR